MLRLYNNRSLPVDMTLDLCYTMIVEQRGVDVEAGRRIYMVNQKKWAPEGALKMNTSM